MPAVAVVVGCAAESVVLPVDNSQAQRCRGETCLECSGHETRSNRINIDGGGNQSPSFSHLSMSSGRAELPAGNAVGRFGDTWICPLQSHFFGGGGSCQFLLVGV